MLAIFKLVCELSSRCTVKQYNKVFPLALGRTFSKLSFGSQWLVQKKKREKIHQRDFKSVIDFKEFEPTKHGLIRAKGVHTSRFEGEGKTEFCRCSINLRVVFSWESDEWFRSPFMLTKNRNFAVVAKPGFQQCQRINRVRASNAETVSVCVKPVD